MGMGKAPRITSESKAKELAGAAVPGFEAVDIGLDRAGFAALASDRHGRIQVIKPHGAHYVGRLLHSSDQSRLDHKLLTVAPDDSHFGKVTLNLGDMAPAWAAKLRHLPAHQQDFPSIAKEHMATGQPHADQPHADQLGGSDA